MTSMLDFQLDDKRLSEGVRINLRDRDGNKTKEWISVLSAHSDSFQKDYEEIIKRYSNDPDADESEARLEGRVALVKDWSFDEKCNKQNVTKFLRHAPHIASLIDKTGGDTRLFFTSAAPSSLNGQGKSSRSSKSRKAAKEVHATT